ncbi:MAG: hypothetical protein HC810_04100 [Acaryochloridaceae cyanobacterium RL_2_7]|nr:hypothetical protein [Acaryochloridaceae cyanobacterium RL_2_7]
MENFLGLALQGTQAYKDVEREVRIRIIRKLMAKHVSLEDISEIVEMPVEEIQHVASNELG